MHVVVKAGAQQKEEFLSKGIPENVWVSFFTCEEMMPGGDAYFDLCFEEEGATFQGITNKPVFVSAVIAKAEELPENYIRINAWNGFLQRKIVEIGNKQNSTFIAAAENILQALNWKYQLVTDTPGMISARVIAMIINEAYFGLGDKISTKAEIDIAMKLGTNYPYGPFEWSEKIGLQKIYALLKKLNETSSRYAIAPAMEKEIHPS
jgi:3-hydroxybutyryl-CoA dehydrogenase